MPETNTAPDRGGMPWQENIVLTLEEAVRELETATTGLPDDLAQMPKEQAERLASAAFVCQSWLHSILAISGPHLRAQLTPRAQPAPIPGDQDQPWHQLVQEDELVNDDRQLDQLYTAIVQPLMRAKTVADDLTELGADEIGAQIDDAMREVAITFHHFQTTVDLRVEAGGREVELEDRLKTEREEARDEANAPIRKRQVAIFEALDRGNLDPFRFEFSLDRHGNTLLTYTSHADREDYTMWADYYYRRIKDLCGGSGLTFIGYGRDSFNRRAIVVTYL